MVLVESEAHFIGHILLTKSVKTLCKVVLLTQFMGKLIYCTLDARRTEHSIWTKQNLLFLVDLLEPGSAWTQWNQTPETLKLLTVLNKYSSLNYLNSNFIGTMWVRSKCIFIEMRLLLTSLVTNLVKAILWSIMFRSEAVSVESKLFYKRFDLKIAFHRIFLEYIMFSSFLALN